ncbi:hypothetical protein [Bergeyella sp. RCAD1439]|uniref:hypothetical protein n=1 Tax=Bergeyella anatis TaxID=3113737 RepID=UPI002E172409|nr:hypothetical protein [Bergeyella sp. RCAD1439]
MRKIIVLLAFGAISLGQAQSYPVSGGWGYESEGWRDEAEYYFPEDYYYEYPADYYQEDYYRSVYADYRRSIDRVNWNRFFRQYRLSPWQIEMILDLNRQFTSFSVWSGYYRANPNRWYYDRFYALERILGARLYRVYYDLYFGGVVPVVYYTNYWADYYRPRYYSYYVLPRYRNININVYRINRQVYHQNVGTRYGWNQPRNNGSVGVLRDGNTAYRSSGQSNNTFRTNNPDRSGSGTFRTAESASRSSNGGGIRESSRESSVGISRGSDSGMRASNGGGFRGQNGGTFRSSEGGSRGDAREAQGRGGSSGRR